VACMLQSPPHQTFILTAMIRNYIKIAFRNITRRKGYSLLNIGGLAVGMSVTMLIGMWVYDEASFNDCHENHARIAQVYQHQTFNDEIKTDATAPMPLATELRASYKNDFKHVVRAWWWQGDHILSIDDKKTLCKGTFMDKGALEMFSFKMLKGSWGSLDDPASVVLSESAAKALFGDADPINQLIRIGNAMDVEVTGVFKAFPYNSQFHTLQFLSTWDLWVASNGWMKAGENSWSENINIFVEIQPGTTFEAVSAKIKDIKLNKIDKARAAREKPQLFLRPMDRSYLHTEWENGHEAGGRIRFVWLFAIIGIFVLLLACINFMNLSTAQSEKRAREVGIRKSVGSVRAQLISQFMSESLLIVVFAFVLALALVTIALPWFNMLADKKMEIPLANPYFWLINAGFILITSLVSGSYPSLYLSSFQPVKVLKGTFKAGRSAATPRRALVVLQFTVSVVLIIGTVIVWQQIEYAKNRPVGYSPEGLIMIRKISPEFWGKFNALKNRLKASDAVTEIADSSSPATEVWFNDGGFDWRGKDPDLQVDFAAVGVTHEYGKTVGWDFIEGRDYSRDYSTDSSAIIINESAARFMGFKEPVNEEVTWNGKKYTVIGVIKDMVMDSPYEPAKKTVFWLNYEGNVWINIRMNPAMSSHEALGRIEKVFQKLLPSVPFDYKFVDQQYALKFAAEERIGSLASLFAALAIFISCLGLFGMASFVAEQRRKEIGIRKILGASTATLWKMLSGEFVLLVGISCLIGIPVAWYLLDQWLQKYEYRTGVSPWIFAGATASALLITLIVVSFQTFKASLANPVNSLRSE
jgi:putative ABC transport system permease protein